MGVAGNVLGSQAESGSNFKLISSSKPTRNGPDRRSAEVGECCGQGNREGEREREMERERE